jgi:4-amino-4-deoxy-L-arabinose transferase-like glycosyltransferase
MTAVGEKAPVIRYLLIFLFGIAVLLPGVAQLPPIDRDESRYVQATKQMVESGDFVDIRFQKQTRYKKPIGIYWLQSASVILSGGDAATSVWAYRLVSVVAMALAFVALYWVGLSLFGAAAAALAALMLAGLFGAGFEGRLAKTDAVLLLLSILAQGLLARIYLASRQGAKAGPMTAWLFWIVQGAAVLVKGPITPFLSVLTIAFLLIFDRDRDRRWLAELKPLRGAVLMVLIVLPWLVMITWKTGGAFWQEAVVKDLLGKVAGGQESHGAWPGYYAVTYSLYIWPFGLVATVGLTHALRKMVSDPRLLFCLAWYLPLWLVLELVPTKLPHYILPAFPAILLLGGWFLSLPASEQPIALAWQRILHGLAGLGVVVVTVGFVAIAIVAPVYLTGSPSVWSLPAAALLLVAGWLGIGVRVHVTPIRRVLVAALTATTSYGLVFGGILPQIDQLWLSRQIAAQFHAEKACADSVLASVTYHEPSLVFLAGTETFMTNALGAADHLLNNPQCAVAAVPDEDAEPFLAVLKEKGAAPVSGKALFGINYSNGPEYIIRLYRLGDN